MNRLDEFSLSLTDEFNLIHEDGYNGDGNVTGLKFFNDISSDNIEDSVLYRLASAKGLKMVPSISYQECLIERMLVILLTNNL